MSYKRPLETVTCNTYQNGTLFTTRMPYVTKPTNHIIGPTPIQFIAAH